MVWINFLKYLIGFNDEHFKMNPKAFFTRDYFPKNLRLNLMQTMLSRAMIYMTGVHSFFHWSSNAILTNFILTSGKCSLTFSIGKRLKIVDVNKMAGLGLRSPQRLHIHVGSLKMTQWLEHLKPMLEVRNLLRTPMLTLNKVIFN